MGIEEWGPREWTITALSGALAIAMPFLTRYKLATDRLLREAVLYTKPRHIAARTVALSIATCLLGIYFAIVATRHTVAWGSMVLTAGALSSVLWYAFRYRCVLHRMENELEEEVEPPT